MTAIVETGPLFTDVEQVAPTELVHPDQFVHLEFTEQDNPALAEAAWRTHARGYFEAGFLTEDAIDPDTGFLPTDIDKSRGPNTDYYLALADDGTYAATMRKIKVAPEETYRDLPAYQLCKDNLSERGAARLDDLEAAGTEIVEISGMAGKTPMAVFETIRTAMHKAIGRDEVWLFSIVSSTYDSLARSWSADNLPVLGEDTPLIDPRVKDGIRLRPAMLDPNTFNDNLLAAYQSAETGPEKARLLRSFEFFTDGLRADQMSLPVLQARRELLAAKEARRSHLAVVTTEGGEMEQSDHLSALLTERAQGPDVWSEPTSFDLSNDADRAEVERLITNGEITGVIDRISEIAHELFELRHPDRQGDAQLRQEFVDGIMAQGAAFGRWFQFPWSKQLVRYPDEADHRALRTARNKNLVTEEEQEQLYKAAVVVGGLSVGSNVVRELVTSGIGGTLILADPDHIGPTNLNRLNGGMTHVGRSKIDHAAIQISEADPYIKQVHFREGITPDNLTELAEYQPSVIFDEVDSMAAKVAMRGFAKEQGVPLVMVTDVGERSVVDVERHDLEDVTPFGGRLSSEMVDKIATGTATVEEIRKSMVAIVGLGNISTKMLESFLEVGQTLPGMPQLGTTASKGGALGADTAREIILNHEVPTGRHAADTRKILHFERERTLGDRFRAIRRLMRAGRSSHAQAA